MSKRWPTLYTSGWSDHCSGVIAMVKPVATISGPSRLSGRRHQARIPLTTYGMTIQAMRKARRPGRSNCLLARARMSEPMTTPMLATAIAQSIHPRRDLLESALAGSALGGAGETRSVMGDLRPRAALPNRVQYSRVCRQAIEIALNSGRTESPQRSGRPAEPGSTGVHAAEPDAGGKEGQRHHPQRLAPYPKAAEQEQGEPDPDKSPDRPPGGHQP